MSNQLESIPQRACACGRSTTGYCTGIHSLSNEDYKKHCASQELKEQVKPELLKG